jgi:hypothetical protein
VSTGGTVIVAVVALKSSPKPYALGTKRHKGGLTRQTRRMERMSGRLRIFKEVLAAEDPAEPKRTELGEHNSDLSIGEAPCSSLPSSPDSFWPSFSRAQGVFREPLGGPPPLPASLLKNDGRPAHKRRPESSFFQIAMPITLSAAVLGIGAAIWLYWFGS